MTVSVRVHSLKQSTPGKVTAIVVVQPSQFASFRIDVAVDDAGSQDRNLQQVAGALLRFSQQFSEALKQPLKIEPTQAPERLGLAAYAASTARHPWAAVSGLTI